MKSSSLLVPTLACLLSSCASGIKPCTQAGDFSRVPLHPYGDLRCHQKRQSNDGPYVNHGEFYQYAPGTETRILEGYFQNGKPTGTWRKYTLEGKDDGEIHFDTATRSEELTPRESESRTKRTNFI